MPINYLREYRKAIKQFEKSARDYAGPQRLAGGTGPTKAKLPKEIRNRFRQIPLRGEEIGTGWR